MVVEDEFLVVIELVSILREAGAEYVHTCRTIEQGLALSDSDGIQAAILDVRIGRHSIAPVARRLAERRTPFLFYTGQVDSDPVTAEWPGCTIVSKPAHPRVIVGAIARLLQPDS